MKWDLIIKVLMKKYDDEMLYKAWKPHVRNRDLAGCTVIHIESTYFIEIQD